MLNVWKEERRKGKKGKKKKLKEKTRRERESLQTRQNSGLDKISNNAQHTLKILRNQEETEWKQGREKERKKRDPR